MNGSPLSDKQIAGLLAHLSDHEHYLLLDTSKPDRLNRQSLLFIDPIDFLVCRANQDRTPFLRQLESVLARGFFLAGWFAYEFFHERRGTVTESSPVILAEFGIYRRPLLYDHYRQTGSFPVLTDPSPFEQDDYSLRDLAPNMGQAAYCRAIDAILDYIAAGDTYQVNYTCKMRFRFSGSVTGLYLDLRRSQPVPYGCFLKHGSRHLLSFSPELFFRTEPGTITADERHLCPGADAGGRPLPGRFFAA
jgi:para-aminobenzoate synthetase/4-amino-4-deoxychorismate lyase